MLITRRIFPPNRLPVFVMGCCLGYMRILANHYPSSNSSSANTTDLFMTPNPLTQTSSDDGGNSVEVRSSPPQQEVASSQTQHLQSPEEQDQGVAQRPFLFSPNNVTSPALLYACIIIFGILLHFVSPAAAFLLRIVVEPLVPLLFFDWILGLTRVKTVSEDIDTLTMVEKFLQSKFMLFMGKISLSFYACHLLLAEYFSILVYYSNHGHITPQNDEDVLLYMAIPSWAIVVVFPLAIGLGWLITVFVEAPMQRCLTKYLTPTDRPNNSTSETDGGNGRVELVGNRSNTGGYDQLQEGDFSLGQDEELQLPPQSLGTGNINVHTSGNLGGDKPEVRISSY